MERRYWNILFVLIFGVSLIVLDGTIVAVSLPVIINDLGLTLTQAQWVSSLYTVVFAALLLPMGVLGDKWGRKKIFLTGLIVFAGASLLAALARGASLMLLARALQGIGGAMVLPATLSTINATFRDRSRATAFGIWGAAMATMAALGPLLGGWITSTFTWPWIFFVNVPLIVAVLPLAWKVLPDNTEDDTQPLPLGSALTSALAFAFIVFGLNEATTYGWWSPRQPFIIGSWEWHPPISASLISLAIGVVLLVLFMVNQTRIQRHKGNVLIDVALFKITSFRHGNLTALTVAAGEFGVLFGLPFYLLNVRGLSPMNTAWILASLAAGAIVSGGLARHISAAIGPALTVVVGLGLEVVGIGFAATLVGPHTSILWLAVVLAVYGCGMGLASAQLASVVLADVPVERSGMGSAIQSTFRQIGSALGVALAGTTLAAAIRADLPDRLTRLHIPEAQADKLAAMTIDSAGGPMEGLSRGKAAVLDALHSGFSYGQHAVLIACGILLFLGFISSLLLWRDAAKRHLDG
ncbi:Antiseptic resistance protein [Arcanobacterium haemolyticum]|uniref:MFS transporter n=1 Tax=Arcanobacterium haemolyticum TaxID=28264 RepID=UPI000D92EDF2|nr:MFS transporter [Arcanobacterium haemolyticum]SPT75396.1 Antiseptic resistance protein [Arcanobacterium haemolyticum]